MPVNKIKKGLDLPITGQPDQNVSAARPVLRVALLAADYIGMKPTMLVKVGDAVKRGQPLFEDKKTPGVVYTSPGAGTVQAINRGDKRAFISIVVELSPSEASGTPRDDEHQPFPHFTGKPVPALSRDDVRALLVESGLWSAFRTRPFSKVPAVDAVPDGIFINGMDTEPLAPDPEVVVARNKDAFEAGLGVIAKLREGKMFLCVGKDSTIKSGPYSGIAVEQFAGPHPAGTVGVHIHTKLPAHRGRIVWHVAYHDVIRIGKLFQSGKLDVSQVVSLAGPSVAKPRLVATRLGASLDQLVEGELLPGEVRVISGSVLAGRTASGAERGYLGRYHVQAACLPEGREREFLGWLTPGKNRFSVINLYASSLRRGTQKFAFTTTTNGSERPMVPIGLYEKVMPMDLLPTFLLRALIIGDVERAEKLGVLELDEEDLALCSFVCPGKYDYAPYLRSILTAIEEEG